MLPCPICGRAMLVSVLFGHVGSERCLSDLQFHRGGKHADPVRGPEAAILSKRLSELLRAA